MKKLRLAIDALCVESFDTAAAGADAHGTVRGNQEEVLRPDPGTGGSGDIRCDTSYIETCIFYTCGGCTTADPEYC